MNEALSNTLEVLLALAVQAHVAHWTTKSGFHHEVLGELYLYAHEAADQLAEPSLAAFDTRTVVAVGKLPAPAGLGLGTAIKAVGKLAAEAEIQEMWLSNIAQEIEAKLLKFKFKLENLS